MSVGGCDGRLMRCVSCVKVVCEGAVLLLYSHVRANSWRAWWLSIEARLISNLQAAPHITPSPARSETTRSAQP